MAHLILTALWLLFFGLLVCDLFLHGAAAKRRRGVDRPV